MLNPLKIKSDFPIFDNSDLIYLDNASTTQKPRDVIEAITTMYLETNANVHRALYTIGSQATEKYEAARKKVASFINAKSEREIVFTSGTTESINLLARTIGDTLEPGDEILISEMEHHANLVPWQMTAERTGAKIVYLPITTSGDLNLNDTKSYFNEKTKIVSITHVSNVLGTVNHVKKIAKMTHDVNAILVIDGAQAVPHQTVDVNDLDCDFYTFSGHKMLGPTGIGVLWGKNELLENMDPFMGGGEMIENVTLEKSTWNTVPYKFEAGTPNFVQAVGLGAAIDYIENIGLQEIQEHENKLTKYTLKRLSQIDGITLYGSPKRRAGVISFNCDGIHPQDLVQFLNEDNIAIRVGHHCAQPLLKVLDEHSIARLSIYVYNDESDIDRLCESLKGIKSFF
tara:strand:+ start:1821 stop:3020 length:1200 start_codon:yes stop_codon:yes gene_type:complete